jgi:osmotically-inducible protein OsmY
MKKLGSLAAMAAAAILAVPAFAADPAPKPAAPAEADNTGRNERDREGGTLTPMDQSENEGDREITQTIRQKIVDHEGMSTNGRNVKVITIDGVVTLRGPVASAAERTAIAGIAKGTPGVKRVDDQLEVATR